jgi:hypothetical protein
MRSAVREGAGESKQKLPSPDIAKEALPHIVTSFGRGRRMTACGTSRTWHDVRDPAVIGWKADLQRDDQIDRYFTTP